MAFSRQAFPEASPASFLRANSQHLSRLTLQRFFFPGARALPLGPVNEVPPERNDSLTPTEDISECFPGRWLDRHNRPAQSTATTTNAACVHYTYSTTTTGVLEGTHAATVRGALQATPLEEHFHTTFVQPVAFPGQSCKEVIVHSFAVAPISFLAGQVTADSVSQIVAGALELPEVSLCWPPIVPCVDGNPTHVIVWPSDLSPDASVGLVDARRVHPLSGPHCWLIELPSPATSGDLMAAAIFRHDICVTSTALRIDGQRTGRSCEVRFGARTLTLLSGRSGEAHCVWVNPDPFSRLPGTQWLRHRKLQPLLLPCRQLFSSRLQPLPRPRRPSLMKGRKPGALDSVQLRSFLSLFTPLPDFAGLVFSMLANRHLVRMCLQPWPMTFMQQDCRLPWQSGGRLREPSS